MDLDSSQHEQEVAITSCEMIAHDPSQQASSIKDVEASETILDETIELQQPCVPMPRAFAMDGTSKDSEMEHDLASNIEGTNVQTKKSTLSNVKKSSPASTVRKVRVSTACSECYFKKLLFVRFSIFFNVFYFYGVLLYTDISDEKGVITLPPTWSISQAPVKLGIEIIVCQIKTLMENDKKNLAVKKYIVIADWSGCMQYYVHGKEVQANEALLPNILNDVSELPTILAKFERMRVCTGLGSVNTTFVKTAEAFTDYTHSWHHNDCSLIVKRNKCESCKRFKSLLWQREHRASKNVKSKRISRVVDDRIKLKILKKKLQTQKRLNNRAKLRMKVLTNALNEAQVEVAALKMESIEEKCLKFNIPDKQRIAIKEICIAAKTTKTGRRYSEDWLMQYMLMNIRSPSYYQYLRNNDIIPLPCTRTIRKYYSIIDTKCGFEMRISQSWLVSISQQKIQCNATACWPSMK